MLNAIGWIATAVFAASYFFRGPAALRRVQAAAACLWIVYGTLLGALPVVAANVIVAGAALWSGRKGNLL
jgi:Bacterial inner membrane protein